MQRGALDDDYAIARSRSSALSFRYRTRARLAVELFRQTNTALAPPRVLDLGAAEGLTLLEIRRLLGGVGTFHGIEISDALIRRAPPLPENVRLFRGDVQALPKELGPDSYDLCCALAVLEHLPEPASALAEIKRVLVPGGSVVISCPNPTWDDIATKLGLLDDGQHLHELDRHSLVSLVKRVGFRDVSFVPFMFMPVASLPYLRVDVPPSAALRWDRWARWLRVPNAAFVNQCVVASKPR